jgi:NAD(P)-dependent dehydrogenase (short-subunit alcohol dehydrogenase family)
MSTWVVTGANRGIGLELARQLKDRGEDVYAACRTPSAELEKLGVHVVAGVDVTNADGAGAAIARALAGKKIDVLLHNAGILVPESIDSLAADTLRKEYEVNAMGPLLLTKALLSHLAPSAKLAFVSSRAGSIGDNGSGGLYGYRMSKAALNMGAMSLARDLQPRGVAVVVLHPGFIRTEMTGGAGNDDPPVAARGLIARIDELTLATTARFLHANGQELPW